MAVVQEQITRQLIAEIEIFIHEGNWRIMINKAIVIKKVVFVLNNATFMVANVIVIDNPIVVNSATTINTTIIIYQYHRYHKQYCRESKKKQKSNTLLKTNWTTS